MTSDELKFLRSCGYDLVGAGKAKPEPVPTGWVEPAARVPAEDVSWLWRNVLAVGKITVVAGVVGVGKSMLVAGDLAARLSAGAGWPDGTEGDPGDVLIASGNDAAEDTLVPRLEAHGADMRRVHFLQGWNGALNDEPSANYWSAPPAGRGDLLPELAQALDERAGVELVVIDPVSAFFDVGARGGRARAVLSALQALAREHSTAIVLVAHLRAASTRATLDVAGAEGLMAAARMVWVVKRDPNDPQRRLFLPAKNNLDDECPGFAWRLMGGKVKWEPGRVECGPAGELVDDLSRARGRREALAAAFIADFLKDGPRMWGVIEHRAKLAGHRPRTLERARGSVAETFKLTGADGRWLWRLIGDTRDWSEGDVVDMLSGDPVGRRASGGAPLRFGAASQPQPAVGQPALNDLDKGPLLDDGGNEVDEL